MAAPDPQKDLAAFSFSFAPTDMSAARTEWNRFVNNTPGGEERSSDKDKKLAPTDGASATPLVSSSSGAGTAVDNESKLSSVKNTVPQGAITREPTSTTDTTTRRAAPNEATITHPEMVTRTVIGPPEFFYFKDNSFYFSETRGKVYFHHCRLKLVSPNDIREPLMPQNIERIRKQDINKFKKVVDPKELSYCEHVVTLPRFDSSDSADIYHVAKGSRHVLRMNGDEVVSETKERFWKHLESYPMHNPFLPWDYEIEFLNAITFGANERIRDFRNTPFPFVDRERFRRIYQDLKGSSIVFWFCAASHN
ncbi:hypothetical protein DFH29DRAFT_1004967 [Suillus ampliporus]|nr:hypothetical protein DFH29DRAFT_1004967 [Suillus ampliporus]